MGSKILASVFTLYLITACGNVAVKAAVTTSYPAVLFALDDPQPPPPPNDGGGGGGEEEPTVGGTTEWTYKSEENNLIAAAQDCDIRCAKIIRLDEGDIGNNTVTRFYVAFIKECDGGNRLGVKILQPNGVVIDDWDGDGESDLEISGSNLPAAKSRYFKIFVFSGFVYIVYLNKNGSDYEIICRRFNKQTPNGGGWEIKISDPAIGPESAPAINISVAGSFPSLLDGDIPDGYEAGTYEHPAVYITYSTGAAIRLVKRRLDTGSITTSSYAPGGNAEFYSPALNELGHIPGSGNGGFEEETLPAHLLVTYVRKSGNKYDLYGVSINKVDITKVSTAWNGGSGPMKLASDILYSADKSSFRVLSDTTVGGVAMFSYQAKDGAETKLFLDAVYYDGMRLVSNPRIVDVVGSGSIQDFRLGFSSPRKGTDKEFKVIIVYSDKRSGGNSSIKAADYYVKYEDVAAGNTALELKWGPEQLSTLYGNMSDGPYLIFDDFDVPEISGPNKQRRTALIFWKEEMASGADYAVAQRITIDKESAHDDVLEWGEGRLISDSPGNKDCITAIVSDDEQYIAVWEDSRANRSAIYGSMINFAGELAGPLPKPDRPTTNRGLTEEGVPFIRVTLEYDTEVVPGSQIDSIELYRSKSAAEGSYEKIHTEPGNMTNFRDFDIEESTTYSYKATATRRSVTSPRSDPQNGTTYTFFPPFIQAVDSGSLSIEVTITNNSNSATILSIEAKVDGSGFVEVFNGSLNTFGSYVHAGLNEGSEYSFRARVSIGGNQSSPYSPVVSAIPTKSNSTGELFIFGPSSGESQGASSPLFGGGAKKGLDAIQEGFGFGSDGSSSKSTCTMSMKATGPHHSITHQALPIIIILSLFMLFTLRRYQVKRT